MNLTMMMKSFSTLTLLALTGALSVAGCGAPAPQTPAASETGATNVTDTATNAAPATETTTNAVATSSALTAPAMKKTATDTKTTGAKTPDTKTTSADKPDPKYRVSDEGATASDADYAAALKKVAVPPPPVSLKVPDKVTVVMQTNEGPITLELNGKEAPLHVKSFVYLANRGFFNGTVFHRHAALLGGDKGYIIQGGDPLTKTPDTAQYAGGGGPGYTIPREHNSLTHQKLVIAAARTKDPDSAGSQFYITQDAVPFLDEGDGYTVFGKVVAGQAAALKLTQGDKLEKVTVETPLPKK